MEARSPTAGLPGRRGRTTRWPSTAAPKEALVRLETTGLVVTSGRSWYVSLFEAEDLLELMELRQLLEPSGLDRLERDGDDAAADELAGYFDAYDEPTGQVVRYERDRPGQLLHIDVKKQGRIPDGGGWRVHGRGPGVARLTEQRGRTGSGAKLGYDFLHVAVDDHSRVAYVEVHEDERGDTAAGFLTRAVAWFASHGSPWSGC